ncbi:hypothetical protein INQ30_24520, partial [Escherichia coli]|nr:hypothetical protein [Escherichia coli]
MDSPSHGQAGSRPAGRVGFARSFLVSAVSMGVALAVFVAAVDPYGLRAAPGHPPGPIMDATQRLSYPQIARGGPFDAA